MTLRVSVCEQHTFKLDRNDTVHDNVAEVHEIKYMRGANITARTSDM